MGGATPSIEAPEQRSKRRGCCGINWCSVAKHQTYGALVVLLVACIVTGVSHFFKEPDVRPLPAFDPTISLPLSPKDTVPMAEAAGLPFVALILTVAMVEFGVMHSKQSLTMSVQASIHVLFMAIVGFAVVLAITEATKPIASRFRPDFMSRCQPLPSAAVSLAQRLDIRKDCKGSNKAEIEDGRKSFPSGHSSNTLSTCWFCILYLVHALYFRQGYLYMGGLWRRGARSFWWRLLLELLQGLLMVWGFTVLCIAWWVGVSRYTDHRHNIDDILGGFIAALLWMTPVTLIAIGQLTFYHQKMREEEEEEEDPVLQAGGKQQQDDEEAQLMAAASANAKCGGSAAAAAPSAAAAAGPTGGAVPAASPALPTAALDALTGQEMPTAELSAEEDTYYDAHSGQRLGVTGAAAARQ